MPAPRPHPAQSLAARCLRPSSQADAAAAPPRDVALEPRFHASSARSRGTLAGARELCGQAVLLGALLATVGCPGDDDSGSDTARDGSFRKISVRVRSVKDAQVRAREGYQAPRS